MRYGPNQWLTDQWLTDQWLTDQWLTDQWQTEGACLWGFNETMCH